MIHKNINKTLGNIKKQFWFTKLQNFQFDNTLQNLKKKKTTNQSTNLERKHFMDRITIDQN